MPGVETLTTCCEFQVAMRGHFTDYLCRVETFGDKDAQQFREDSGQGSPSPLMGEVLSLNVWQGWQGSGISEPCHVILAAINANQA